MTQIIEPGTAWGGPYTVAVPSVLQVRGAGPVYVAIGELPARADGGLLMRPESPVLLPPLVGGSQVWVRREAEATGAQVAIVDWVAAP